MDLIDEARTEQYRSNSNAAKEAAKEEKKIEKVVSGQVKVRKKSEWQKLGDIFIAEDAQSVKSMILMDVIVPAIKKVITDVVTNGISMILYGSTAKSRETNGSRVSYSSYYNGGYSTRKEEKRDRYAYDNIVLESRAEAEEVLTRMFECLDKYGNVSVNDLYDLVGIDGDYTDARYGWRDLKNADVVRVRDGYQLKLPRVMPLN